MSDTRRLMEYDANKKSVLAAYLLLFLLGWLGGHRFYVGRTGSAVLLLGLVIAPMIFLIGAGAQAGDGDVTASLGGIAVIGWLAAAIWLLVDIFLLPGMVQKYNNDLIQRLEASQGIRVAD